MSEQVPETLKPRVSLSFEVEAPFGVLDYEMEDAIYESPFLPASGMINGEPHTIFLHWFNTTVRTFSNNVDSSHIDFRNDQDRLQGIKIGDDVIDLMLEYDYPHHHSPFIDEASIKWLAAQALGDLDEELRDL